MTFLQKWLSAIGCLLLLLSTAGCEAPGKPKGDELAAADVTDFPTLFATNCAGCHGAQGKNGPGRILNDALYLSFIPKAELKDVLIYGRAANGMPAWSQKHGGPLTDKQIDVLTEGIYASWAKPFDTHGEPMPAYSAPIENADIAHGKKLFNKACYMCHGQGARVGLVSSPEYLQLVSNQMLRTSIVVGRPDLGMPNYMHLNAGKSLAGADLTDVVAYLVSLRPVSDKGDGEVSKEIK